MICPECKKEVSEECTVCPSCGYPLEALKFVEETEEISERQANTNRDSITAGDVCKFSAVLIGVVVFFLGIFMGNEYSNKYDEFNWICAAIVWVSDYIFSLFLFVIGDIAKNIKDVRDCAVESSSCKEEK